jgi:hypothetical protein
LRVIVGRIVEYATRDQGFELALPREQAATALMISNGFAIERLADPNAVPDELYAQAIAAHPGRATADRSNAAAAGPGGLVVIALG